ncbi:MAG: molybdopterin-dependent oxidoreductase, partial [Desulfotignum sp.]
MRYFPGTQGYSGISHGSVCSSSHCLHGHGKGPLVPYPDKGAAPGNRCNRRTSLVFKALKAGATGISIDPRRSETGKKCNLWLPIRPGTDAALALAMIHFIIYEDLYDKDFVENHTVGFN